MDIIHAAVSFDKTCDTLYSNIDLFGAYVPHTNATVPLVTPLDLDYLPPGGIAETYHRLKIAKPLLDKDK